MGAQLQNVFFVIFLVGVFWFVAIRPQQQRTKQMRAMIASLEPGAEIVTVGGIYGTVIEVGERIRIRVVDGSEFEVAKQAIGQVLPTPATEVAADAPDADEPAADEPATDEVPVQVPAGENDGETAPDA